MLVFLDTEFTQFAAPDLISIALVAEDGREFYGERSDYNRESCSAFVIETVVPLLGRMPSAVCTAQALSGRLCAWFDELPEPATVVFDFAPDWHLLVVAMLGHEAHHPPGNFAQALHLDSYAITHPMFEKALNAAFSDDWPPHHALADARALMAGYRAWRLFMERIWKIQ
ncbi:MAG: hypothetical protein ACD_23C01047G0002 [uncultured bacterium]|jgi:hypothetical protein|nr:MAG: hypothetical protein ACD_23C01047G0002 [uncultured bacterium]